jgi:phage shock protein E
MNLVYLLLPSLAILIAGNLQGAERKVEKKYKTVRVAEFDKLRADKKAVVLDVRTPEEYSAGHIAGSTNIDFNADDFDKKISKLDKDKTYLVHCAAGGRSARACSKLDKLKFEHLYNLEGGMGAWEKAGKPIEK